MKHITGIFKGRYKGQEVDPLRLKTINTLHFLNVDAGATITDCKWIDDYRKSEFNKQLLNVNSVPSADVYFNTTNHPNEKPFRENLHSCILIDPSISNVMHKDGYTYGDIEGKIYGTIGSIKDSTTITTNGIEFTPIYNYEKTALPITIANPLSDFIVEKPSTWRWGSIIPVLLWAFFLGWGLWWLINHRGCNRIRQTNFDNTKTDSIPVKDDNDSLQFNSKNITFSVYDWYLEDHDTVSLYLNGISIKENIPLSLQPVSWVEPTVNHGRNALLIESVNDGLSGPASPTIEINDGRNVKVFQMRVYRGKPKKIYLNINQ
ncbi:MAG: hypothetical protein E6H07_07760 [Bacteroidetes bacterium]|nr:MAG: hypothetical protein E6H07_07760 [Bacteroidota bacterium]